MKMLLASVLFLAMSYTSVVFGKTITLDFAAWDGALPLPDGWTLSGVTQSSQEGDFHGGLWFRGVKHWLKSPRFGYVITAVSMDVAYSVGDGEEITRFLVLYPIVNGIEAKVGWVIPTPPYVKDYERVNGDISGHETDEFILRLDGTNSDGNWYVSKVVLEIDETHPVSHPVEPEPEPFHLGLTNCWKVSEFDKGEGGCLERTADFSSIRFGRDKKTAAWTNGVSVDSFYAYSSTGACTQIRLAATNSLYYGIYSAVTNGSYALALLGVDKVAMNVILPIEFDQERSLSELAVEYDAWQFTDRKQTTLTLSVCAVDELAAADLADWITSDVYTSGVSSVSRFIRFPQKSLNKSRYMCFRWSVPRQSTSSMLGMTNLRVAAQSDPEGFLLLIR